MQVRVRGNWVHLLVSKYQRLDKETGKGKTSEVQRVAQFPADATEIPDDFPVILSDEDIEKIMRKAILPARERERQRIESEAAAREAAAAHAIDPNWRMDAAWEPLSEALGVIDARGPALRPEQFLRVVERCTEIGLRASEIDSDPRTLVAQLLSALASSLSTIAQRIDSTTFPTPANGNVKESSMYRAWVDVGNAKQSLQTALQKKEYVQTRGGENTKIKK